jgi:hypothetical protein
MPLDSVVFAEPSSALDSSYHIVEMTQGNCYTIVFQDLVCEPAAMAIWETSAPPVEILNVERLTSPSAAPSPDQSVSIQITLNHPPSPEERLYVTYTTDGWQSREFLEVSDFDSTGAVGHAVISGVAGGVTVAYQVLTSVAELPAGDEVVTDMRICRSGSIQSYTTAMTWSTAFSPSSADWESPGLWASGQVPPAGADVTLASNVVLSGPVAINNLVLAAGVLTYDNASEEKLTIGGSLEVLAGADLDMANSEADLVIDGYLTVRGRLALSSGASGNLSIGGDFEVAEGGVFEANGRVITFNGAIGQTLRSPHPLSMHHLVMDKPLDTLRLEVPVDVLPGGTFTPVSGVMDLAGMPLRLHADVTGTAEVGVVTGKVLGDLVYERFVPANIHGVPRYINVSPSVEGVAVSDWSAAGALSVLRYDETVVGGLNAGWTSSGDTLIPGVGYMAQFPGDTSTTLVTSGPLNSGDQAIGLSRTPSGNAANDGWNLIGNPYPAPVVLASVDWTSADSAAAPSGYWIYDADNLGYVVKLTDDPIAVGESVWVQANGSGTLHFEEANKLLPDDLPYVFAIRVTEPQGFWSRGICRFPQESTENFDPDQDMRTVGNPLAEGRVTVWFETADDQKVAILGIPPGSYEAIPVHLLTGSAGTYVWGLDEVYGGLDVACIALTDTWTGQQVWFSGDSASALTVDLAADTHYPDRFVLTSHVTPTVTPEAARCGLSGRIDLGWSAAEALGWTATWAGPQSGTASNLTSIDSLSAGSYEVSWTRLNGDCAASTVASVPEACKGDFDADGFRGASDLLLLLSQFGVWGALDPLSIYDCDCDGEMSVGDLLEFLVFFAQTCSDD